MEYISFDDIIENLILMQYIIYKKIYTRIYNIRERDDAMAATLKPVNGAFVLNSNKVAEFLAKKANKVQIL